MVLNDLLLVFFAIVTFSHSPFSSQSLLVDQRTWPFPPLDRTVSLSPGTRPLMMGDSLNYMVALTTTSDGQSESANQTTQTQLTFTALSHSENYTVSVVAVNSLGQQGPSAVGTFRTRDIRE